MSQQQGPARKISAKALVRAVEGPEKKVLVYPFRKPKYEKPKHNPFSG